MNPQIACTDDEVESCFDILKGLRPHLESAGFLDRIRRQESQGYRIITMRSDRGVECLAGFRIAEFLAWGKILYVDDLVTDPRCRRQGHAERLMLWLIQHAIEEGCSSIQLDSGYARYDVHRFYHKSGFKLMAHHLELDLRC